MAVYKSTVLVLLCQDWSETSQVVHLLAREVGRVRCLAKGSRRGQNPFSGPLDRWTLGEAVFSVTDPNHLATLMELYETERFAGLRRRLPAFYGASYVTELILALVPDLERQPALFDLAVQTLRLLAKAEKEACQAITLACAWRMLAILGYGAAMDRCVECGKPLPAGAVQYSSAAGGPVCGKCPPKGRTRHLTAKAAGGLAFLASADWAEVRRVRLTAATATALRQILTDRVAELAGHKLASARYV